LLPKRRIRFNEKLAANKLKRSLKNDDSDSGSEMEVDPREVYAPDFKEKWAALVKLKELEKVKQKALEKAQSSDKQKDDGNSDGGSK
jgi:hypothetical protein